MNADAYLALVHHSVEPVIDGVLDKGLDRYLVTHIFEQTLIHIKRISELIFVSVALDYQVALGVAKLVADSDKLVSVADAYSEQLREGADHLNRFFAVILLAHPLNGVERVIKEVGIYLRLKSLELGLSENYLLIMHLFHERLYHMHHVLKRRGEGAELNYIRLVRFIFICFRLLFKALH